MALETKIPTGFVSGTLSGMTGVVTEVDEDPDTSGTDFLIATGNNVATAVVVDFDTPTGNPKVGADLQEFRMQVREFDPGQTGTPKARIELWENGSLVRAGTDVDVTTQDQVLAFTWNANELATADGSLVQCKFVGSKTGGSPTVRNTTELGAIEWNVEFVGATDLAGGATAGSYAVTGAAATLLVGTVLAAGATAGSYSITGAAATTVPGQVLNAGAAAGSYSVTGAPATTVQARVLAGGATAGSYAVTGAPATSGGPTNIDTQQKRMAVASIGRPWMRAQFPVATPTQAWRMSVAHAYVNALDVPAGGFFSRRYYDEFLGGA